MYLTAVLGYIVVEELQVIVQVINSVRLDPLGLIAPFLPYRGRDFLDGLPPGGVESGTDVAQGLAQLDAIRLTFEDLEPNVGRYASSSSYRRRPTCPRRWPGCC